MFISHADYFKNTLWILLSGWRDFTEATINKIKVCFDFIMPIPVLEQSTPLSVFVKKYYDIIISQDVLLLPYATPSFCLKYPKSNIYFCHLIKDLA